eukprot:gene5051-34841_t
MSDPVETADVSDLSSASQIILYVSGKYFECFDFLHPCSLFLAPVFISRSSLAIVTLTFAYVIYRCISSITSALADRAAEKKTSKKAPKAAPVEAPQKHAPKEDAASHHHLFLNTLKGHLDVVTSVSWSADGGSIVTSCEDLTVRVFQLGSDMTNRDPKNKRVKTNKLPVGACFANDSTVMVLEKGKFTDLLLPCLTAEGMEDPDLELDVPH